MNTENVLNESIDIIDNRLESFDFFPLRFICFILLLTGLTLIAFGLFVFNDYWVSIFGLLLSIAIYPIATLQKRITVNITENKYRVYHTFFGIKKGEWEFFKGFTIITIIPFTQLQQIGSRYGASSISVQSDIFYLNLKKDNYNKLNIAAGYYDSMLEKAIVLAHRYQVGIMDCSEKPNKKYTYEEIVQHFPKETY
jgi:hypothetical protein